MRKIHVPPVGMTPQRAQHSGTTRRRFLTTAFAFAGGTALAGVVKHIGLDRKEIDDLRTYSKGRNLHVQETDWAEKVWPTVQQRLVRLYAAEKLDNEELHAGKIALKDRRVKIAYTNFISPGERGNDGDLGPSFHVVKRFDDRQKDGTVLRTYVNESWPLFISQRKVQVQENGQTTEKFKLNIGILPAETIRARVQVFSGDLTKPGAEDLFVTDYLQAIWAIDPGGVLGGQRGVYPSFARQHLFGEQITVEDRKVNLQNQVFVPVSSPLKCASCHSSKATFTQEIFLKAGEKKTNYGAITPDEDFSNKKKLQDQLGYRQIESFLRGQLRDESTILDTALVNAILRDLKNSRNVELPYMAEAIREVGDIPWLDSDVKPNYAQGVDFGFVYRDKVLEGNEIKEREFEKAMAAHYRDSIYLGGWWFRNDLVLIPR